MREKVFEAFFGVGGGERCGGGERGVVEEGRGGVCRRGAEDVEEDSGGVERRGREECGGGEGRDVEERKGEE